MSSLQRTYKSVTNMQLIIAPLTPLLIILISFQISTAQFPTECMDPADLTARKCCPLFDGSECGSDDGRGVCGIITLPEERSCVRDAWPYYFDRVCICNHNFAGYDCSRCKYGYYGDSCNDSKVMDRRPISEYSQQQWEDYVKILNLTKTHHSGHSVFLEEPPTSSSDPSQLPTSTISLYDLFVWQHHYPAKDNALKKDYAHESTGFPTWHRQFLLWFEWEVQYMLKSMGKEDYYMFRIPYWDWRKEKQTNDNSPFKSNRLGETVDDNGLPEVYGIMHSEFLNNWETICWTKDENHDICNPQVATGQLQRCPLRESCGSENELWPTDNDVQTALGMQEYDTFPYNKKAANSFRNQLEGFKPLSNDEIQFCRENKLCTCERGEAGDYNCTESDDGPQPTDPIQRLLHNSVHIILGLGYFGSNAFKDPEISGVMADVAASANDPIFLNHHAMVDCIFETWLQNHPSVQYPMESDTNKIPPGHRYDDYIVPFFPLYKHSDMFSTADKFGYRCTLSSKRPTWMIAVIGVVVGIISLCLIASVVCICCCCIIKCKNQKANKPVEGSRDKGYGSTEHEAKNTESNPLIQES